MEMEGEVAEEGKAPVSRQCVRTAARGVSRVGGSEKEGGLFVDEVRPDADSRRPE